MCSCFYLRLSKQLVGGLGARLADEVSDMIVRIKRGLSRCCYSQPPEPPGTTNLLRSEFLTCHIVCTFLPTLAHTVYTWMTESSNFSVETLDKLFFPKLEMHRNFQTFSKYVRSDRIYIFKLWRVCPMLRDQRMAVEYFVRCFIRLIFGLNVSRCGDCREFGSFAVIFSRNFSL